VVTNQAYKIGLISDFNQQNLAVLLGKNPTVAATCQTAPYGQTLRLLLDPHDPFWTEALDALVLWALPQLAVPGFQKLLSGEEFSPAELLDQVDAFAGWFGRFRTGSAPSFCPPGCCRMATAAWAR